MSDDNLETGEAEASDLDVLNEGADNEEETSEETSSEETEQEESPEDESLEDSNEEEEESSEESEEESEEEELEEPEITRPSWRMIKEKFPELAKDKDFREMFHREKAYTETFPTIEEAKSAKEKADVLDFFEGTLDAGDPTPFIRSLDENTAPLIAERFLPALAQVSPKLFGIATKPMLVNMLTAAANKANEIQDKNLAMSVRNITKFLFGTPEIPKLAAADPEVEAEKKRLQDQRLTLEQRDQLNFTTKVDASIKKSLEKVILDGLDPKNELSEFTKSALVKQVIEDTKNEMLNDTNFKGRLQSLFAQAKKAGFPPDYLPRLVSAYLGRAKTTALTLRAKHKSAAVVKKPKLPKTRIEASETKTTPQTETKKGAKKSDLDIIMEGA